MFRRWVVTFNYPFDDERSSIGFLPHLNEWIEENAAGDCKIRASQADALRWLITGSAYVGEISCKLKDDATMILMAFK